jgi:RNA recognition motif-containing protein
VKSCAIDWDRAGRSNETAVVEYAKEEDAERALNKLPGTEVEGKAFIVEVAPQQIRQFKRTGIKKDWRK